MTFNPVSGAVNAAGVKTIDSGRMPPVSIAGANSLAAVGCSSMSQCVAVDINGNGFTGTVPKASALK